MSVTLRMPLPPPPSDALIMRGNPTRSAAEAASATLLTLAESMSAWDSPSVAYLTRTSAPFHAMVGTPADWAMMVEPILSPNARMAAPEGPMNLMLFAFSVSGSVGYSLACPHPAHTASARTACAFSTMRRTLA